MMEQEYQESPQDVLFILKVDMGGNRHECISFRQDDTPEEAAFSFCKEHNLNIKIYDFIVDSLRQKYHQITCGLSSDTKSKGQTCPTGFGLTSTQDYETEMKSPPEQQSSDQPSIQKTQHFLSTTQTTTKKQTSRPTSQSYWRVPECDEEQPESLRVQPQPPSADISHYRGKH